MPLRVNLKENDFFRNAILVGEKEGLGQGIVEATKKGMELGMGIGHRYGQSSLLIRQLEHRFGKLPKWATEQLAKADATTLEAWGVQLLDAKKLEEVVPRAAKKRRPSLR